jgi:membrane-associated phospholipid phosphatase
MSLGYLLHFVPFMLALIYYAFIADMGKGSVFYGGMFSVIGIGFLGYTLMPAEGPFVYFNGQYTKELTGYYITMLNNVIVKAGSAQFDVFPSLHTGVALYLLMSFYSHNKKIFLLYLPLFITIICATVYLRYHYFFDLACGAMLCVTCFYLSSLINNYASKSEANMNTRYERM